MDERVHVPLALNEPPLPPSLHDTAPEGELASITFAVKVIVFPAVTEAELDDTVVVVPEEEGVVALEEAMVEAVPVGCPGNRRNCAPKNTGTTSATAIATIINKVRRLFFPEDTTAIIMHSEFPF